jgi:hypothetical protein
MTSTPYTSDRPQPPDALATPRLRVDGRVFFTVGLIALVALAGWTRLITYERYLPVFQHVDETFRFIHAYQLRPDAPLGDQYGQIEWAQGFPPGQPWVAMASQRFVESRIPFPYPPDYIRVLRQLSALVNVGTVILIALTGYRLMRRHGPSTAAWVGLLAALPWAVAPRVVGTGNLALMDPLIFPLVALALLLTVISIQDDNGWAAFGSLLAVIATIYLKYLLIYALWLPFCAVAVMTWQRRWRVWPWIAVMAVVSAVTAGWLLFVHQALSLDNRESEAFYDSGLVNMLSPIRNLDNIAFTLSESVGVWLFGGVMIAGAVAYIVNRRRNADMIDLRWLWVLLPYMLANVMLTSSVDILRTWEPHWFRVRYTLPAAIGFMLLMGLAAAQIVFALRGTRLHPLRWTVPLIIALLIGIPSTVTNVANARDWSQPHVYEAIWAWADASLPDDGTFILSAGSPLHKLWNRPWSGYNGVTAFRWEFTDTPYDKSPEQWVDDGFAYFAMTAADMENIYTDPAMTDWLDSLYPLKTIPAGPGIDSDTTFYRVLPPQVTANDTFGDVVTLVGYDLSSDTVSGGDVLTLRPYWQVNTIPPATLSMFVHLVAAGEDQPLVQFDGAPVSERRLPITWDDPSEVLIGNTAALALPADLPPGDYELRIGLYDFSSGVRLSLPDGVEFVNVSLRSR